MGQFTCGCLKTLSPRGNEDYVRFGIRCPLHIAVSNGRCLQTRHEFTVGFDV